MAVDIGATPTPPGAPGPSTAVVGVQPGRRGQAAQVVVRRNRAVLRLLEGIALCDQVIGDCDAIAIAVTTEDWRTALLLAGRLSNRADEARTEMRRLAGAIDTA